MTILDRSNLRKVIKTISIFASLCSLSSLFVSTLLASSHYTQKQLDALAIRVNKTYWVVAVEGKTPSFLTEPSTKASSFLGEVNESFEITEIAGKNAKNPFYKVRFASGKTGYLRPEAFMEEFNLRIVAADPLAEEEEKERIAWIRSQPWSAAVKEAAIKRQPTPGMSVNEVKKLLGQPHRVIKPNARQRATEEQWLYRNGSTLIFNNGVLSRIEVKQTKED